MARNACLPPAMASSMRLGRPLEQGGGARLPLRHGNAAGLRFIELVKQDQAAAGIHDRDRDIPAVLARFRFAGRRHFLRGFQRDEFCSAEHWCPPQEVNKRAFGYVLALRTPHVPISPARAHLEDFPILRSLQKRFTFGSLGRTARRTCRQRRRKRCGSPWMTLPCWPIALAIFERCVGFFLIHAPSQPPQRLYSEPLSRGTVPIPQSPGSR